jgi:type IX secretion system PorP/SprF family membrane protein
MKKLLIIIGIIGGMSLNAVSQQLPLYSQYMFNRLLLNPAVTGSHDDIPIRLTARQQWVGIDKAPSTQIISGHYRLKNETMGLGGIVFADRFGPESRIGIQANYAYILPVFSNEGRLAFGLSFQVFQYQLDYTQMVAIDDDDPALMYNQENAWLPESDFGLYLYGEKYFAGISANQMIELPMNVGGQEVEMNTLVRHYHVMGGYRFDTGEDFSLEPSVLAKGTFDTPYQFDANIKGIYKENYWLGVSYRTSGDVIAMLGLEINDIVFGFAYDYSTSRLSHYQDGTFELMIGYNFSRKAPGSQSFF